MATLIVSHGPAKPDAVKHRLVGRKHPSSPSDRSAQDGQTNIKRHRLDLASVWLSQLTKLDLVGRGSTSLVYKGQLANGQLVALKQNRVCSMLTDVNSEALMLGRLQHSPRVVKLHASLFWSRDASTCHCGKSRHSSHGQQLLILQWLPETFSHVLAKASQSAAERDASTQAESGNVTLNQVRLLYAINYGPQLLTALAHCHKQNIIHGDIKPDNILIDGQQLFLADFGSSCSGSQDSKVVKTNLAYRSPEALLGASAQPSNDCWAAGLILLELLTGICPWAIDEQSKTLTANSSAEDWERDRLRRIIKLCGLSRETKDELSKLPQGQWLDDYPPQSSMLPLLLSGPALDLVSGLLQLSATTRLTAEAAVNSSRALSPGSADSQLDS